jgi:hypothetical protein
VRIDHEGRDILVAEERLDGADTAAVFEEMVVKECRKLWQVARFERSEARAARRTALWMTVSWRWWRRLWPV